MNKLVYVAVVAFLFAGGLAAGVIHKGMQSKKGGGPIITTQASAETPPPGLSLQDLNASTPTEGLPASETLGTVAPDASAATPVADAAPPAPDPLEGGRSFGSGDAPPVDPLTGRSTAVASAPTSGKSRSKPPREDFGGGRIPDNTEIFSEPTILEVDPAYESAPKPKKGARAAAPPPEADPFEEMPTIDDVPVDTAPPPPEPAFEPEPPPTKVAMTKPSFSGGGGDLVFAAGSRKPALTKVAQKQSGAKSIVRIEFAGATKWKIIQLPKRRQVWIDLEGTEVPGGTNSVGGSVAHVREISAKYISNDGGGIPYARVIVQLDDGVVQMNDRGKEELNVSPNRGGGDASGFFEVVIGAKQQQF